ncbi:MAG TPA: crossover junction endodeoxyribonuclease RuvC, partial [Urbifossiella sp.]|nr:crossover junction endodeoxyribonuclease RuvC [Urbifossiella sp.]
MSPTPPPPPPRRVLGLDPGLQTTGYAVLELAPDGPKVCEAGVVRSAAGREPADMAVRVKTLYDGVCE